MTSTRRFQPGAIKRVCVIGAGPSGLAAVRYLIAEKHFTTIDVFEQRPTVGGVWNINTKNGRPSPIPSTDPFWDGCNVPTPEQPTQNDSTETESQTSSDLVVAQETKQAQGTAYQFDSPLYPTLETNIPHQIMAYFGAPFSTTQRVLNGGLDGIGKHGSKSTSATTSSGSESSSTAVEPHVPLFPPYSIVLSYLRQYSLPLLPYIKFSTQVISAVPTPDSNPPTQTNSPPTTKWSITTRDLTTSQTTTTIYDALIVANGHYTVPYLPPIPGIESWSAAYPNSVIHSRDFRSLTPYHNSKTVVIGNSASAIDISQQISSVTSQPVIRVIRTNTPTDQLHTYKLLTEFLPPSSPSSSSPASETNSRAIKFTTATGSPHIETGITHLVFATGYLYSFPFFPPNFHTSLISPSPSPSSSIPSTPASLPGHRVHSTYKHLLHTPHPTLAFLVLPMKVIPFPLAEAQSAVLARLWSGRLDLPNQTEMEEWERKRVQEKGEGKGFHTLGAVGEDVDYLNGLVEWAGRADQLEEEEQEGPVDGPDDRFSPQQQPSLPLLHTWSPEIRWLRIQFPEIRRRYLELGTEEKRKQVRDWEDLGVSYHQSF